MPITYTQLAINNAWSMTVSLNLDGTGTSITIPLISPISNVWASLGGYAPSGYAPTSGLVTINGNQYNYMSTINFSTAQWNISISPLGDSPSPPVGRISFSVDLFYPGV